MGDTKFNASTKISYDCAKDEWCESEVEVCIESEPFSKGAMRSAYKMLLRQNGGQVTPWVAKRIAISRALTRSFVSLISQSITRLWRMI